MVDCTTGSKKGRGRDVGIYDFVTAQPTSVFF